MIYFLVKSIQGQRLGDTSKLVRSDKLRNNIDISEDLILLILMIINFDAK